MNLILEKTDQVSYFTDMREVLHAAGLLAEDYDWYLSDIETNRTVPGFSSYDCWLSGAALREALQSDGLQFIWGVVSAVPKGCRPSVKSELGADGNPHYWKVRDLRPQLEGALFEIACWDGSATLLIGLPDEAAARFKERFSDCRSLNELVDELANQTLLQTDSGTR